MTITHDRAEAASTRGDWEEAARLWTALIPTETGATAIRFRLRTAEALGHLHRWSEIDPLIQAGLVDAPGHSGLLRYAAWSAEKRGEWSEAARLWGLSLGASKKPPPKAVIRDAVRTSCWAGDIAQAERLARMRTARPMTPRETRDLSAEIGGHALRVKAGLSTANAPAPPKLSVQEICRAFWEVERRLDLLDWRAGDVALWPLLRLSAYYRLTQQLGLYDHPHPALKSSLALEATTGRPLQEVLPGRSDLVISATKKMNGSEPYTDAVRQALGDRAVVLDRPVDGELLAGAVNFNTVISDMRQRYAEDADRFLSAEDQFRIFQIQDAFRSETGMAPAGLMRSARMYVGAFRAVRRGFSALFAAHPVQRLFLTNGYGVTLRAVVDAARTAGVRTIELQHGFISEFHLGYSWPGRPEVPHAPDELWTFGDFWAETTPLPAQTATRVIGAPYVADKAKEAPPRDPNLVVFTSQGVIGRRLVVMALETARRRPDKRIVFRLHPNEAVSDFEALIPSDAPANFSLSARTPNIFALLAQAEIQVGAFSTTLLEGMALGVRTVVLDMPGIEYMTPVIRRGDALFMKTVDALVDNLDYAPRAGDPGAYYAEPADLSDL